MYLINVFTRRYQKDTHQIYKLRTSNSVRDRNRERSKRCALTGTQPVLYDEKLVFYSKTFICTHGWQFNPRGKGIRTNHTVRGIGCKARLNALLKQDEGGVYTVCVSKHTSVHNHSVGPEEYFTYAETRKVDSPDTKIVVKTMWQGKINSSTTYSWSFANMMSYRWVQPQKDSAIFKRSIRKTDPAKGRRKHDCSDATRNIHLAG